MSARLEELVRRRETLVRRCAVQRVVLAQAHARLERPAAIADQVIAAGAYLRRHPALVAGIGTALVLLRTGRSGGWLARASSVVRVLRSAMLLRKLLRI